MTSTTANKVYLVTGAASGYGHALCTRLHSDPAENLHGNVQLVLVDLNQDAGTKFAAELNAKRPNSAMYAKADVTSSDQMRAVFQSAKERFGRIDVVVNNAGVGELGIFHTDELEAWRKVIDIDLNAVILGTALAIQYGASTVVNIASAAGLGPLDAAPVYAAAKHGVIGFSTSLTKLYKKTGVRVNAVAPFFSDTPLVSKGRQEYEAFDRALSRLPMTPIKDVVEAILRAVRDTDLYSRVLVVSPKGINVLPVRMAKM
ncbi:hypothetical protein BCR44DRAFT_1413847 [Catenaria anguillulae PL171]|uniref:Uncharacterized protein n=1 Tax=Catenaria anguillulae PL171 TaxID=765915 RepID=A0A1Y2HU11_9FUNG|nr:hypothetical protein BCR44DRAFT_1413847 [Catenaria anguillulae PL171]